MFIVQVFRPEVRGPYDGRTEDWEAYQANPFEGIEILGFCNTENEVNTLIDSYQEKPNGKNWKFHYEEIRSQLITEIG